MGLRLELHRLQLASEWPNTMVRLGGQRPICIWTMEPAQMWLLLKAGLTKKGQKRRTRVSTDPISRVDRGHHENTDLDEGAFSKTFLMTLLTARISGLYNLFDGVCVEAVQTSLPSKVDFDDPRFPVTEKFAVNFKKAVNFEKACYLQNMQNTPTLFLLSHDVLLQFPKASSRMHFCTFFSFLSHSLLSSVQ